MAETDIYSAFCKRVGSQDSQKPLYGDARAEADRPRHTPLTGNGNPLVQVYTENAPKIYNKSPELFPKAKQADEAMVQQLINSDSRFSEKGLRHYMQNPRIKEHQKTTEYIKQTIEGYPSLAFDYGWFKQDPTKASNL